MTVQPVRGAPPPIPSNRPFLTGRELTYIAQALEDGLRANKGRFTDACCRWMRSELGARKVILTHSATAALEMSALLCDVRPGDEVIMPSFTYVSTANAFQLRGARICFVDIRPDTLNVDENLIATAVSERTKVIVPVHYGGVGAAMDEIMALADARGLVVVEDAAQAVGATYGDRHLGTIGHLGAYSFHVTKNLMCGQGGALVVNDDRFAARAEVIAEEGTDRERFMRGEVDKYTWNDVGSSFLASEITAAFLWAQLEQAQMISERRRAVVDHYQRALEPLARRGLLRLPYTPPGCRHNAHLFYLVLPDRQTCAALDAHLDRHHVQAARHYVPLHTSPMGQRLGHRAGDLPVTEDVSERLLRLPCYVGLEPRDQDRIVAAIEQCLAGGGG